MRLRNGGPPHQAWVVIGPSGSGKSTLGKALAAHLAAPFIEADALHPKANIEKMMAGHPLDDADRDPWLAAVAEAIARARAASPHVVAACSALKRKYRDRLARESGGPVLFIHQQVSRQVLATRLAARRGHFMPPSLLHSQLEAFEPPQAGENAITLPAGLDPQALVEACLQAASGTPSI